MSNYLCKSSGGMDLPATSGSSDMIFKGCKFNDSEGNSIIGTMINRGDSTNGGGDCSLYLNSSHPTIGISLTDAAYFTVNSDGVNRFCMQAAKGAYGVGASTNLGYIGLGATFFGSASASDVRSGVTFTSQNGLGLTGTMNIAASLKTKTVSSGNIGGNYTYTVTEGTLIGITGVQVHHWYDSDNAVMNSYISGNTIHVDMAFTGGTIRDCSVTFAYI